MGELTNANQAMERREIVDFPTEIAGIEEELVRQRQYTLTLYTDQPPAFWQPVKFPYLKIVNPPLWELAHIAWFAEFFCLRWREDDIKGLKVPSCLAESDALFDSAAVIHSARWTNTYPSVDMCFDFMRRSLDRVLAALYASEENARHAFQLAIAHEDMHAEALLMTLNTLGLPRPTLVGNPHRLEESVHDIGFDAGEIALGASQRAFQFDNEMPAHMVHVQPFLMASRVVSAAEFAAFCESPDYHDDRFWTDKGILWRRAGYRRPPVEDGWAPAMHVNYFQADAWCRWANRRLPSEVEWEYAVAHSRDMFQSTGRVWEWTSSAFSGFPGFVPGPYRDYSAPWFGNHMVLRGGSFATHARLKYPQYRNFFTPERTDIFCGFRTCAIA